ncbi:hypothetical protein [Streptomyces fulvoviolaceus]|nr:hypothetical protein [Streptomyces fulvoviolaceus]
MQPPAARAASLANSAEPHPYSATSTIDEAAHRGIDLQVRARNGMT